MGILSVLKNGLLRTRPAPGVSLPFCSPCSHLTRANLGRCRAGGREVNYLRALRGFGWYCTVVFGKLGSWKFL